MKNFEAKVMIRSGNANIPHTVRLSAENSFSAQQQLTAQYGVGNIVTIPYEVAAGGSYVSAPWMEKF